MLSLAAAGLIFGGFFLPWMDGSGPFSLRSFSGFDLARLVRNFEITADSSSSTAQVRASAVVIYLIPALAVNGVLLHVAAPLAGLRRMAAWALVAASVYALGVLSLILFLSLVPVNDFEAVVGAPSWGFGLTLVGGVVLGWTGRRELRREALGPSGRAGRVS